MEFNENQNRALMATALHDLADMINRGQTYVPTSIVLHQQYVTTDELLAVADTVYDRPIAANILSTVATVRVPVGEKLAMPIEWVFYTQLKKDDFDRALQIEAIRTHNDNCVPVPYETVDEAQHGQSDDLHATPDAR